MKTIEQTHQIILSEDYSCKIDGVLYSISVVYDPNKMITYYRIVNETNLGVSDFEKRINLTSTDVANFKRLNHFSYKIIYNSDNSINHIGFNTLLDARNYMLVVMRWLMQQCIDIVVTGTNNVDFICRLKTLGLKIIPYGDKSLLFPDIDESKIKMYNYEETTDDYNTCLNITIKKKKTLKFDFHE